ncbi:tripartite tricarboxylate transporter permease [Halotalea alkalilenta]|uniref:tripartite tricarboxylate transporter permease n=1 Tax=Halotalea alkalilenta TaxID=376489 RepID=UPI000483550F|nr:tripartite tricarboxylate transporter permease [Halotalea alkalilenta]
MLEMLGQGLVLAMQWQVLLFLLLGVVVGIIVGSLPGLTSTMGVALLLPLTFAMEAATGILFLIGVYFGSMYGGSVTAILINTPGSPAAAATVLDGYPMTRKGEAYKALQISTLCSSIGGFISVLVLILVAPQLAAFALRFSAPETFALALFGLSIISTLSSGSMVKGLISGFAGLLLATIGLDPISGITRFSGDSLHLLGGISFIAVMIGLFAMSEVFRMMEGSSAVRAATGQMVKSVKDKAGLSWKEFKSLIVTLLRSTGIGTGIGMIPGAGADVAAFVAYNEAKRFDKDPESFGKGSLKGVAAPEAANNSLTGGAMVPLLTLGIPGDAVTAVLLGALLVQGLQPGPMLFENNGPLVYTLFIGMLLANVLIFVIGWSCIRLFTRILSVPIGLMIPVILVLCVVGAYALNNQFFDVIVMLLAGMLGYAMKRYDFPVAPLVLGMILGPMMESNLRRALIMSQGSLDIFYTRPVTAVLLLLALATLLSPLFRWLRTRRR